MKKIFTSVLLITSLITPLLAQKKQIIFAVMNDGKTLEPIVQIDKGKMLEVESNAENGWKDFAKMYYKPKTTYNLIFGGNASGKASIVKDLAGTDCGANQADVTIISPQKAKFKGLVRALATDVPVKKGLGTRRLPTSVERTEIEKLVRDEMTKQKVSAANMKGLRSHNLTALDVNNDKKAEFVGSYWLPTAKTERVGLFFIAEKGADGKYSLTYSDFQTVKAAEMMGGAEITEFDKGRLNELLLDAFDADGDGTAEIFTIGQAFEGNNFQIYKRADGKWTQALKVYNYHCAF